MKALDAKAMELSSQDAQLKAALFRFVDEGGDRPPPLAAAMRMGNSRAGRAALGTAAAAGVKHMAQRFIVGDSPAAARGVLRDLWKRGVASSVDLLGEATVTDDEA